MINIGTWYISKRHRNNDAGIMTGIMIIMNNDRL